MRALPAACTYPRCTRTRPTQTGASAARARCHRTADSARRRHRTHGRRRWAPRARRWAPELLEERAGDKRRMRPDVPWDLAARRRVRLHAASAPRATSAALRWRAPQGSAPRSWRLSHPQELRGTPSSFTDAELFEESATAELPTTAGRLQLDHALVRERRDRCDRGRCDSAAAGRLALAVAECGPRAPLPHGTNTRPKYPNFGFQGSCVHTARPYDAF